jgi:hypothetical protein
MDKQSLIDIARALLIALAAIAVFIGWFWLHLSRAKALLRALAAHGRFQILSFDKRYMIGTGPFKWWTTSRSQIIYHIRVRDREGRERSGWVRCGSYLGGVLFSKQTEVRWDDHENAA